MPAVLLRVCLFTEQLAQFLWAQRAAAVVVDQRKRFSQSLLCVGDGRGRHHVQKLLERDLPVAVRVVCSKLFRELSKTQREG